MTARSAPWAAPAALFVALAALGVAVERGALQGIDHFGYEHLQPLHSGDWSRLPDVASPAIASVLVAIAALRLRGDPGLATAWVAALGAGAAIELIGKPVVAHPYPHPDEVPWLAHEGFPSGHTMRGLIVAGALSAAWPRARGLLVGWAVVNAVLVEVTRMHVISEVMGGAVAGLALATAVGAVRGRTARSLHEATLGRGRADDLAQPAGTGLTCSGQVASVVRGDSRSCPH
jgi:membrane-associated phospholipid phosphatase